MNKESVPTRNIIRYLLKVLDFNEYKSPNTYDEKGDNSNLKIIKDVFDLSIKNGKLYNVYERLANHYEKKCKKTIDIVFLPKVIEVITKEHPNRDNIPTSIPVSLFYLKIKLKHDNSIEWNEAKIIWNSRVEYPSSLNEVSFCTDSNENENKEILNWDSVINLFEKRFRTKWGYTYIKDKKNEEFCFCNSKQVEVKNKPYMPWVMRYDDVFDTTIVSRNEIINGKLNASYYLNFTNGKEYKENEDKSINVAIIPKGFDRILRDQEEGNENVKSVSPFYIKASLQEDNFLNLKSAKVVWAKVIESPSEIDGVSFKVNEVEESNLSSKDLTWECFLDSVKYDYENRYGIKWEDKTIEDIRNNKHTIFQPKDGYYWITPEETVDNTTGGIIKLLNYLENHHDIDLPLLTTMFGNEIKLNKSNFFLGLDLPEHHGQMKNEYPLADAQREAVHCITRLKEGDVLAVSGPPGTGKTTLLQTVVAEMMVEYAIEKKPAPLILATSSNNKAITNIIEAFSIGDKGEVADELFTRWIDYNEKPLPFAMYWPSSKIRNELKEKEKNGDSNIPFYTNNHGKDNYQSLKNNRRKLEHSFIQHANSSKHITFRKNNIQDIKKLLHEKLIERIGYVKEIERTLSNQNDSVQIKSMINRIISRLIHQNKSFLTTEDIISDLESLVKTYSFISIKDVKKEMKKKSEKEPLVSIRPQEIEEYILTEKINQLKKRKEKNGKESSLSDSQYIDKLLDMSIRYECFWLAIHYYEACWLETINNKEWEEKENTVDKKIREMSFICPCIIATFFKAPDGFHEIDGTYLTNFLDLLIVDEAGQACNENGLATFALAKKAIVVGDIKQIPPVYSISSQISNKYWDTFMQQDANEDLFNILNCGKSCIMKIASKKSAFNGAEEDVDGLFLDEHRRCYDEIIAYSNKLLYHGRLTPRKGSGTKEKSLPKMPIMAHHSVVENNKYSIIGKDADDSTIKDWQKKYGIEKLNIKYNNSKSRFNLYEVDAIYKWINDNKDCLYNKYNQEKDEDAKEMPLGKIISIITPFKLQAEFLKAALGESFKNSIGTVHTFQGAESPIVIYSTVYGSEEDFAFINGEVGENLMNVAVSRAKEHFFLFCSKSIEELPKETINNITEWDNAFDLLLKMASIKLEDKY